MIENITHYFHVFKKWLFLWLETSDFFIGDWKKHGGVMFLPVKIILHQEPSVILLNYIIISISILGFYLIIFFYFQIAFPLHNMQEPWLHLQCIRHKEFSTF